MKKPVAWICLSAVLIFGGLLVGLYRSKSTFPVAGKVAEDPMSVKNIAAEVAGQNVNPRSENTSPSILDQPGERISTTVQKILDEPSLSYRSYPKPSAVQPLNSLEESALITRYKSITSLTNKYAIVWLLCLGGNEATADLFMEGLTNEFAEKLLSDEEESLLMLHAAKLGLLPDKSSRVFEFLRKGTDPTFWKENKRWISSDETMARLAPLRLSKQSIVGLGFSGRPEVPGLLAELRELVDTRTTPSRLNHAIVNAALYHSVFQRQERDGIVDEILTGNEMGYLERWHNTPEGMEWTKWAEAIDVRP